LNRKGAITFSADFFFKIIEINISTTKINIDPIKPACAVTHVWYFKGHKKLALKFIDSLMSNFDKNLTILSTFSIGYL
jgi:hypothetical protein